MQKLDLEFAIEHGIINTDDVLNQIEHGILPFRVVGAPSVMVP